MKTKLFAGAILIALVLAGCATPGQPIGEFMAMGDYSGEPVMLDGQIGRGIQVTGTNVYLTLLEGKGMRVPMLTDTEYPYGTRMTVLARAYDYDGAAYDEMDEATKAVLSDFVETVEPGDEEQIEFQTGNVAQFLKTFAIGSGADFFIIEEIVDEE
jgi:hypothetical protein